MRNVINAHGLTEILWEFFSRPRCELMWKRSKHGINVIGPIYVLSQLV